jgi:hypothetical protein
MRVPRLTSARMLRHLDPSNSVPLARAHRAFDTPGRRA